MVGNALRNTVETDVQAGASGGKSSDKPGLVVMFDSRERILGDLPDTGIQSPIPEGTKQPDVLVHEREQAFCRLQARRFSEAKGWDVLQAAEIVEGTLGDVPVEIARYVQTLFKNVPTQGKTKGGKATNPRSDRRLDRYSAMCQMVGEELLEMHKIPVTLPGTSSKSSYTDRMRYFQKGRYWITLSSQVRQALNVDLDLHKIAPGTKDEYQYRNYREILAGAKAAKAALAKAKAASEARSEEGNAGTEGDAELQPATPTGLKVNPNLPDKVRSQWNRLHACVHEAQYETDAEDAKDSDSMTNLAARILSHACVLFKDAEDGEISNEDVSFVIKAFHERKRAQKTRAANAAKQPGAPKADEPQAPETTHEANEAADLADLEAAQHDAATEGLPDVTNAPDASVNE